MKHSSLVLPSLCFFWPQGSFVEKVRFSSIKKLPVIEDLPDPFLKPDGERVKKRKEWTAQRERLKALLVHYAYGKMPPRQACP